MRPVEENNALNCIFVSSKTRNPVLLYLCPKLLEDSSLEYSLVVQMLGRCIKSSFVEIRISDNTETIRGWELIRFLCEKPLIMRRVSYGRISDEFRSGWSYDPSL